MEVAVPRTRYVPPPTARGSGADQPLALPPHKTDEQDTDEPPEKPPESEPVCKDCEPGWGRARLAVALRSGPFGEQTFGRKTDWQMGMGLWAGWMSSFGLYAGIGYFLVPSEYVSVASTELTLTRHPIEVFAGYRFGLDQFAADGELAVVLDLSSRRAEAAGSDQLDADPADRTWLAVGLLPRLRIEYAALEPVAIFLGLGLQVLLRRVEYLGDFPQGGEYPRSGVLLRPHLISPQVEVGLAFSLGAASTSSQNGPAKER